MELEKAKKELESLLKQRNEKQVKITTYDLFGAIETVLQALDNSIPKEKVKENIKVAKQTPRKEFCNYDDYTFGKIRALEKLLEE